MLSLIFNLTITNTFFLHRLDKNPMQFEFSSHMSSNLVYYKYIHLDNNYVAPNNLLSAIVKKLISFRKKKLLSILCLYYNIRWTCIILRSFFFHVISNLFFSPMILHFLSRKFMEYWIRFEYKYSKDYYVVWKKLTSMH